MTAATTRKLADKAVARGIKWLDANVPGWRKKIDLDSLDLKFPCDCVLGQIDGNFYEGVWVHRLTRAQVFAFGFNATAATPFGALTAAWRRALKRRKK